MALTQLDLWPKPTDEDPASTLPSVRALPVLASRVELASLQHNTERVRFYVSHAHADRTRTAYERDFRTFHRWCMASGLCSLPATSETLALYLTALIDSGRKVSTVRRARIAI